MFEDYYTCSPSVSYNNGRVLRFKGIPYFWSSAKGNDLDNHLSNLLYFTKLKYALSTSGKRIKCQSTRGISWQGNLSVNLRYNLAGEDDMQSTGGITQQSICQSSYLRYNLAGGSVSQSSSHRCNLAGGLSVTVT